MDFFKHFIPHLVNNFHPHTTRYYALFIYALAFSVLNFLVFPIAGVSTGNALASNIDPDELIILANRERNERGLGNLVKNDKLTVAANSKGNDMFAKQYWSHIGPNGETPWQFIQASGYDYVYAGENLAKDFSTSLEVHLAWMNSPTHRANILNKNYRDIGIAVVSGMLNGKYSTIIIVQFGSREYEKPNILKNTFTTSIEEYTPIIQEPKSDSVFRDQNIKLTGISEKGDAIKVFSNDKEIGELPKGENNFSINIDLYESNNKIYIKAKDTTNGKESLSSNTVNVIIDNTPPDTENVKIDLFKQQNGQRLLLIKPSELLISIEIQIGTKISKLQKKDGDFYIILEESDYKSDGTADLYFYDEAGNVSSKKIDLNSYQNNGHVPSYILLTNSNSSTWQNFFSWMKLGNREKINLLITGAFLLLIVVDAIYMLKRGHIREWSSKHGFTVGVITMLFIGILTI